MQVELKAVTLLWSLDHSLYEHVGRMYIIVVQYIAINITLMIMIHLRWSYRVSCDS